MSNPSTRFSSHTVIGSTKLPVVESQIWRAKVRTPLFPYPTLFRSRVVAPFPHRRRLGRDVEPEHSILLPHRDRLDETARREVADLESKSAHSTLPLPDSLPISGSGSIPASEAPGP